MQGKTISEFIDYLISKGYTEEQAEITAERIYWY